VSGRATCIRHRRGVDTSPSKSTRLSAQCTCRLYSDPGQFHPVVETLFSLVAADYSSWTSIIHTTHHDTSETPLAGTPQTSNGARGPLKTTGSSAPPI
jgi:hypothetical protein